jgi:small multidrug resistance pump
MFQVAIRIPQPVADRGAGMSYIYLAAAIVCEVAATSLLKVSNGMRELTPAIGVVIGYGTSLYLLSLTLRVIPVGVAYAIWSGVGVVLITIVGLLWFKQVLDFAAIAGMVLIMTGVAVIFLFSKASAT